jgi:ubiquinone/menaquinone biosynthesis C-methylase UbiE
VGEEAPAVPEGAEAEDRGDVLKPSLREKERGYYLGAERAAGFDARSASPMSTARYRAVAEEINKLLTQGRLLDIGCGTGRLAIEIARLIPDVSITGIDVSGEMLVLAGANARREGLSERFSFRNIGAEDLCAFEKDSFELVLTSGSFSGWLRPAEALSEAARTLSPGGFLYITDWNRDASDAFASIMRRAMNEHSHLERIIMAREASYNEKEFKDILASCPLRLEEFRTQDHWMTAVLRK